MNNESLTAYVIMAPADRTQQLDVAITSENVASLQPSVEAVQQVTTLCAARGFDVGPFVGISFAITGPPELFSQSFHPVQGGGLELEDADPAVAQLIETVVMDEAAELFGGTEEEAKDGPDGEDGSESQHSQNVSGGPDGASQDRADQDRGDQDRDDLDSDSQDSDDQDREPQ